MTPTRARRIVTVALAVGAGAAIAKKVTAGEMPSPRIAVATFVVAVALLAVADAAPKLAAGIAITSLIGGAIAAGPDATNALTKYLTTEGK